MSKVPMTINGVVKLKNELNYLKNVRRPDIIKAISDARSHGDLKENAEYHAAKEQQIFCEKRIYEIELKLANAHIIDVTKIINNNYVVFGATVSLKNIKTNEIQKYCIVGDDEANIKNNLISIHSPIARSIIRKKVSDIVIVNTPKGKIKYEIIKIEYL
ncbi:MAG: transcription elongation factor GreA [Candidatus Lightella neohaematopini]|nr:transcription elongation factor GreA [Candidatus Lightella neohaematopini]MCV2531125.1 transcription elongation factor GreA [Candidatus Lightella neohaematopini]